jgi:hypothetical protein
VNEQPLAQIAAFDSGGIRVMTLEKNFGLTPRKPQ